MASFIFSSIIAFLLLYQNHNAVNAENLDDDYFYNNCKISSNNDSTRMVALRLVPTANNVHNVSNITIKVGKNGEGEYLTEALCKQAAGSNHTLLYPVMSFDDFWQECIFGAGEIFRGDVYLYYHNKSAHIFTINFTPQKYNFASCLQLDFAPKDPKVLLDSNQVVISYSVPHYSKLFGSTFHVEYKRHDEDSYHRKPECSILDEDCMGRCRCTLDSERVKPCINYTVCILNTICDKTAYYCKDLTLKPTINTPRTLHSSYDGSKLYFSWQKREAYRELDEYYRYKIRKTGFLVEGSTRNTNTTSMISCVKDMEVSIEVAMCLSLNISECVCSRFAQTTVHLSCDHKANLYAEEIIIPIVGAVFLVLLYKLVAIYRKSRSQDMSSLNNSQGSTREIFNLGQLASIQLSSDSSSVKPRLSNDYDYPGHITMIYSPGQGTQGTRGCLGPAAFDLGEEDEDPYIHHIDNLFDDNINRVVVSNVVHVRPADQDSC